MRSTTRANLRFLTCLAAAAALFAARAALAEEASVPFGEAPGGPSADELVAALAAPEASARINAVRALGERGDASVVPRLTAMLRSDPVPEVRGWAVRALHQLGTPEAHSAVAAAAREDPDERVRTMAGQLEGVTPPPPQPFGPVQPRVQVPSQVVVPTSPPYLQPQQPVRIPGRGLRVGGIVMTASSYGLALLVGLALISAGDEPATEWDEPRNFVDWGWKLLLPVVGPAVAATTNDAGGVSVVFWLWSALEIAGITMLSIGYARRARWQRENPEPDDDAPQARRSSFSIAVTPTPGGLALGGTF